MGGASEQNDEVALLFLVISCMTARRNAAALVMTHTGIEASGAWLQGAAAAGEASEGGQAAAR